VVFDTYGNSALPALLLIHGMANTAQSCYGRVIPHLDGYHVILCQLDGHTDEEDGLFVSIEDCCEKIERYVSKHLGGKLYGLSGFSMGATIAVELMARGRISIEKVILDAAWCVKLGVLTPIYTSIFCWAMGRIKAGKTIPDFLIESSMGKGNAGIVDTFYKNIDLQSIRNACRDVYGYQISDELSAFQGQVVFWHGSSEPYPRKTAKLLKQYLPQMQVEVFPGLGHGQFLRQQPEAYARKLKEFMGEPLKDPPTEGRRK
jgi:pimeloyl-ACP methyl ester carboxylesterase